MTPLPYPYKQFLHASSVLYCLLKSSTNDCILYKRSLVSAAKQWYIAELILPTPIFSILPDFFRLISKSGLSFWKSVQIVEIDFMVSTISNWQNWLMKSMAAILNIVLSKSTHFQDKTNQLRLSTGKIF